MVLLVPGRLSQEVKELAGWQFHHILYLWCYLLGDLYTVWFVEYSSQQDGMGTKNFDLKVKQSDRHTELFIYNTNKYN